MKKKVEVLGITIANMKDADICFHLLIKGCKVDIHMDIRTGNAFISDEDITRMYQEGRLSFKSDLLSFKEVFWSYRTALDILTDYII